MSAISRRNQFMSFILAAVASIAVVSCSASSDEALMDLEQQIVQLNELYDDMYDDYAELSLRIDRLDKKLSNDKFVAKAPEAVVEAERTKRADYLISKSKLEAALEQFFKADIRPD